MKSIMGMILALVIGYGAGNIVPAAYADWTVGENQRFFERVARAAEGIHNAYQTGKFLRTLADDEVIGTDPLFVDVDPWTKAEVVAMKSVLEDLETFVEGGAVLPDENRGAAINSMLLGLQ